MPILVFSDSLLSNLVIGKMDSLIVNPGLTVDSLMRKEEMKEVDSLSSMLKEIHYETVVLCLGINDLGMGFSSKEVVDKLVKLHELCFSRGVKRVIALFLYERFYEFNLLYERESDDRVEFSDILLNLNDCDLEDDKVHPKIKFCLRDIIQTE